VAYLLLFKPARAMSHYVVYHNPDAMGYPASDVTGFSVVTDKSAPSDSQGSTIWLLTGEGTPRQYYLVQRFGADRIESGADQGFRTRIAADTGDHFRPMIRIDEEEWFRDFQRSQGNFSFGLQRVNDDRFIKGLEEVASRGPHQ
jgi:hypothetical protein